MLWYVVTFEGNKKSIYSLCNFHNFFKEHSDFSPLFKAKI